MFFFDFSHHGGTFNVLHARPTCHRRTEGSEAAACSGDLPSRAAKKKRRHKAHMNGSWRRMEKQGQTGRTTPHATGTSSSVSFVASASVAEQTNKQKPCEQSREGDQQGRGRGHTRQRPPPGRSSFRHVQSPVEERNRSTTPFPVFIRPAMAAGKKNTNTHTHRHA